MFCLNQMGRSWSESAQASLKFYALHRYQKARHTQKAFPPFSSGHQGCVPKPHLQGTGTPNTQTNLQIQGSSVKMFLFLLPAPSQTPQGTSLFLTFSVRILFCQVCTNAEEKKPQMLPKCSHSSNERQERKQETGESIRKQCSNSSWHESRTLAIQKWAYFS